GESILQNGPRRLAELSVDALGPLFMRQTKVETPSVPAISLTSLWLSVVNCPSSATHLIALSNSFSVSLTSRTNACRCRTMDSRISLVRASGVRFISSRTACVTCSRPSIIIGFDLQGEEVQEMEEVEEVKEVEERKNRPDANGCARFYPLLPLLPSPPLLPQSPLLPFCFGLSICWA